MKKVLTKAIRVTTAMLLVIALVVAATPVQAAGVSNTALKWTTQTSAGTGAWQSVTYAPELGRFVAVASASSFPFNVLQRIMWSDDGKNWTITQTVSPPARPLFTSVTWSPDLDLFVAVVCGDTVSATVCPGTGNTIMTSPDGITWTSRTTPDATAGWRSVVWGNGKFVAVAEVGTNQTMTSTNGITWTAAAAPEANAWRSVTYSPQLGLYVAVAISGTNRVMTSPDGITWTPHTAAEANSWMSVTWSAERSLFVAVANDGTNRVMTSPDGTTWTARAASAANTWRSVTWSAELGEFMAVADTGTNRIMHSTDGITWTGMPAASDNAWNSVIWVPEERAFVAVASGNTSTTRVMTGAIATSTTEDATNVAARSATLNGDYQDNFVGSNVNVFFRYRLAGSSDPFTETTPQPVTAAGAFTANISSLTPNNTAYEYKAVLQWPSNGGTQTLEGGLKTFTTAYADDDNDSVPNVIEDAAPNSGDANNDGTQDSTQANVASLVSSVTNKYAVLELDTVCQIAAVTVNIESSNAVTDLLYDYPVGLMGFTADCGTPGFTAHANQFYFEGASAAYTIRKYNPTTNMYATLNDGTYQVTVVGGQNAIKASFTVTDGSSADADGIVNGTIVDPTGLALPVATAFGPTVPNANGGLANTGENVSTFVIISLLTIGSAVAFWVVRIRKQLSLFGS